MIPTPLATHQLPSWYSEVLALPRETRRVLRPKAVETAGGIPRRVNLRQSSPWSESAIDIERNAPSPCSETDHRLGPELPIDII
jgi:hypothetical protein